MARKRNGRGGRSAAAKARRTGQLREQASLESQQTNSSPQNGRPQQNNPVQEVIRLQPHFKSIGFQCTFEDVNSMAEGENRYTLKPDDDFGIRWSIAIGHENGLLQLSVYNTTKSDQFILHVDYKIEVIGTVTKDLKGQLRGNEPFREFGSKQFMEWETVLVMLKSGGFTVRVYMDIIKTVEINRKPLVELDKPRSLTNVALVVVDQKFYIERGFLCLHARDYFEPLLCGKFKEGNKPEVTILGHDPRDVQTVLELMHMERPLNDSSVEGALLFANYCSAKLVVQMCQSFLLEESKKSQKKKFDMFVKHTLPLDEILNQTNNEEEVISLFPEDIESLDRSVKLALLKKIASFP